MKYYLNVGPEAFLELKKKQQKGVLQVGDESPVGVRNLPLSEGEEEPSHPKEGDSGKKGGEENSVEKKVPTPGAAEMRIVDPWKTAFLLVKHSNLSSLKIYPKLRDAYLYDDSQGYFVKFDKNELLVIMSAILALAKLTGLRNSRYLREVLDNLFTLPLCFY